MPSSKASKLGINVMNNIIQFKLRGSRDYVHGTDIYNSLTSLTGSNGIKNIKLSILRIIRSPQCHFLITQNAQSLSKLGELCAKFEYETESGFNLIGLAEHQKQGLVVSKVNFDENLVFSKCDLFNLGVKLNGPTSLSFIENVVLMAKHMHTSFFPSETLKWMFTGINLDKIFDTHHRLELLLRQRVGSNHTKAQ